MSTPDPQLVREQARQIILSHAKDVDYTSIGEIIADYDEFSSLPEDEFERVQGQIDKLIRNATVTVSWPDEEAQVPTGGMPEDRLGVWLDHARRNHPTTMTPSLLGDLREVLAQHKIMVDHLVECPAMTDEEGA